MPKKPNISKKLIKLGRSLKRERVNAELTQERLAELADLNIRTIQKIESGDTNILITTAQRLKKAIGCEWDELLD